MDDHTRDQAQAQARIEPLLADANRLRARGDLDGAEKRCREALVLATGNPEAHELLGDIFYQRRQGPLAVEYYRLARAANPQRRTLEDKIGRASLLVAEANITRLRAQDLLAGRAAQTPRRPGIAAVLSLVVPGFGQLYNGQHLKGAVIVCVWLLLVLGAVGSALSSLRGRPTAASAGLSQFEPVALLGVLFSTPTLWWTLLWMALWIYSIADAALYAAKTMTAPEDLV